MSTGRPPSGGLTEVTLPSGARVRGHLPTLGTLLRRDLLPRNLLATALKAADPTWLTAARAVDPEGAAADARAYLAILVAAFPRQRWVGPGEDDWTAWRITPEALTDDSLDELDVDVLENVVLRLVTPEEATAASRELDEELTTGIASWDEFVASPEGERLARMAMAWGVRPSAVLGEPDEVVAFALDEALATVHAISERRAQKNVGAPAGERFLDVADLEDAEDADDPVETVGAAA